MHLTTYENLLSDTTKVLKKHHLSEEQAKIISNVLLHANLRGVDSHGVLRLEHYVKRIKSGGINIHPNINFEDSSQSTGIMDGDNGFGHYISDKAVEKGIELCKETGVYAIAVKNSSHCGALSYFVDKIANHNLIGIAMSHTDSSVVPFGGKEPFFGTNPMAFGIPMENNNNIILDFATSTVALGKILDAKDNNKSIPEGWGVDEKGNATKDPNKVKYLTPFGGPKGYGLAMIIEIFSSLLTGSAFGPHITKMYGDYNKNRELGHFFILIDPSKFVTIEDFTDKLKNMVKELKEVQTANGFTEILVPGEIEKNNEVKNRKNGINLSDSTFKFIKKETEQ
ncbi:ureidoglycolate dehydrogenase [Staphylococcus cohnii]|nr:ureidoglycolate dehydrogenase [Staphylococcus cohnii]